MKLEYISSMTKDHHVKVPFPKFETMVKIKSKNKWVANITNNLFLDSIQFCKCNNINLKVKMLTL